MSATGQAATPDGAHGNGGDTAGAQQVPDSDWRGNQHWASWDSLARQDFSNGARVLGERGGGKDYGRDSLEIAGQVAITIGSPTCWVINGVKMTAPLDKDGMIHPSPADQQSKARDELRFSQRRSPMRSQLISMMMSKILVMPVVRTR